MRVLVTGASGLLGSRLVPALLERGDRVITTSRKPGRHEWPEGVETVAWDGGTDLQAPSVDAVVNLAGANTFDRRWSGPYKRILWQSRVDLTRNLAHWINGQDDPPEVMVNASAVGYYGIRPDGPQQEQAPQGNDFLARLCGAWEEAATHIDGRVVRFRNGVILDPTGGALGKLLPLYRARIGGRLGDGTQPFPWVHHEDAVRAILWAIDNDAHGAYNLTGPESVTQRQLHETLARVLGVFSGWKVPGFAVHLLVGEAGSMLTGGQDAPPGRLQAAGFTFRHGRLEPALHEMVAKAG